MKPTIDLNDTGNRIIAGILLAFIFVGGWWLIARSISTSDASDTKTSVETPTTTSSEENSATAAPVGDTPTIAASNESIDVVDQPAGKSVSVKKAKLAQTSWIAVRDGNGRTLGAARFEPGTHENVAVPLLRGTVAGQSYQVLMYVDDGNKKFDLHEDILVTKSDGSVAGDVFSAR